MQRARLCIAVAAAMSGVALAMCTAENPEIQDVNRPILNGVASTSATDGILMYNGSASCTASAVSVTVDGAPAQYILTAAHCIVGHNLSANGFEFQFTNVAGQPRVPLTNMFVSGNGAVDNGSVAKCGDFAVAEFNAGCHTLPGAAFSAVGTQIPATGTGLNVHGVRLQTAPDSYPDGDLNGTIWASSFNVAAVSGNLLTLGAFATAPGDSGGRASDSAGAARGVVTGIDSAAQKTILSAVTADGIVALMGGQWVAGCGAPSADGGVTNLVSTPSRTPSDCATDAGIDASDGGEAGGDGAVASTSPTTICP